MGNTNIVDFNRIIANPERGQEIARLFMAARSWTDDKTTRDAYDAFAAETEDQYRHMIASGLKVKFTENDPYPDARVMFADVSRGVLKVFKSKPGHHPYMSVRETDVFRAVHDFHGHYGTGRGFDRHGEEAAWVRHSQMYSPLARRAMTTETRAQNNAFIWVYQGRVFPPQKMMLLPPWASDVTNYDTL